MKKREPDRAIHVYASIKFDVAELAKWPPDKIAAVMKGIGLLSAAGDEDRRA